MHGARRLWPVAWPLLLAAVLALTLACSGPSPEPTPTRPRPVLPTPIPTPSQNAALQFEEEPDEVEAAFHAEVEQVIAQAQFLAGIPCDRLRDARTGDSAIVSRLRAFASTLKQIASTDQALDRQATPFLLKRMDDALDELDLRVAGCRIQ